MKWHIVFNKPVMKNTLLIIQVIVLGFLAQFGDFNGEGSNELYANKMSKSTLVTNHINIPETPPDDNVKDFIVEMYDARMMDLEEGKLAIEKGERPEVKKYGEWMVHEQTKLSTQLQALAESKNVSLPNTISKEKAEGLAELKEQGGKDFDKKFLKMMKIDHRRDVRKLKSARRKINDAEVHNFISTYQPMIESHLEYLKTID